MAEEENIRTYRLAAFGFERTGLNAKEESIQDRNFTLEFLQYKTDLQLNDYDGVIMPQGIFEYFRTDENYFGGPTQSGAYDKHELDKRRKEVDLLIRKGGFICFLLTQKFVERIDQKSFRDSDLAKIYMNYSGFYRDNFSTRIPSGIKSLRNEFRKLFDIHGAACSYFKNHNDNLEWRIIAKIDDYVVSFVLRDQIFYIPVMLPDNRIDEFFRTLCDALTSTINKLHIEIPKWVENFNLHQEQIHREEIANLEVRIENIEVKVSQLNLFKRVLISTDDLLVEDVAHILQNGFKLPVNDVDELKEDLKILDKYGKPIAFIEVKGVNSGVKRDHINQADSHRDRAGLPSSFPSILVINTHIKNSRTVKEKDQEVAEEQIKHAVAMKVLVIRTLDILSLLRLHLSGKLGQNEFLQLFTKETGWLRVTDDGIVIYKGEAM